jgi:TM2 domain-containing membrane protein YozV
VFDFGEVQGRFYLVMEFVDGLTLRQVMQAGKILPEQALELVPKICEALQYAHGQGIVHRDIKPENILLDKQGRLKIADFGIAKIAGVEGKGLSLTGARDVMGTPVYMAPEQVEKPQTVDHRADIYSLGVVFYEMLTGELPLGKFAPPSKKVQMDVRLDEVVLHALEKEPARRYQQASQVKTALETIAGSPPPIGAAAGPAPAPAPDNSVSDKIILPAFLLAFFFGPFGAHRFYVGKYGTAVLQLFTCGGLGIWATIDWILLACGVFTDADGRRMKNWIHPGPSLPRPAGQAAPVANVAAGVAPQRDLFWRRFAIVIVCLISIPIVIAIFGLLAAIAIPNFVRARAHAHGDDYPGPVKILTPEELKAAGIREENGEYWKNSTQSFPLDANGRFSIDNVSGKIQVEGWSSNLVVLEAVIHGKDGNCVDATKITADTNSDRVAIHTARPAEARSFVWSWLWTHHSLWEEPTEDYVVRVPKGVRVAKVSTVNGTVEVSRVEGDIDVSSVNGQVDVKEAKHNLNLATVNGAARASMERLGAGQSVSFSAVNGEFDLTLPQDADGQFSVTTVNGYIASDFPSLKSKHGIVGNNLNGSLGNGDAKVKVDAVNGTVKFLKASADEGAGTNATPPPNQ